MSITIKLISRLLSSTVTSDSSFQTEGVHSSAFSDQTKHFLIVVPILKYIYSISFIIPDNMSVELCYILYMQTALALKKCLSPSQNTNICRIVLKINRTNNLAVVTSGVPKFRSFDKAEPNSQFRGKYIRNNLIRIRVWLIYKLSGTTDLRATAPDPRSLCPLSSTEFVESPRTKFLGTPLVVTET
jgi:hypothetical protein